MQDMFTRTTVFCNTGPSNCETFPERLKPNTKPTTKKAAKGFEKSSKFQMSCAQVFPDLTGYIPS